MECVSCGGIGCDKCGDTGRMNIIGCPQMIITPDVWEIIELAELYEKGLPPVAGGSLDQAKSFVSACKFIWSEQQAWKNKLGIFS